MTTTLLKNCSGQVCSGDIPLVNPSINTTTNKNQLNGYLYDNSGNTTKDANSRKFTYDGENKQTKVETVDINGTVTGLVGQYWYDGDGKRVRKYAQWCARCSNLLWLWQRPPTKAISNSCKLGLTASIQFQ